MRVILLLALLAAASAALAQTPAQGVNFYSVEKEIELGKSLAAKFQANEQAQPDARLQAIGDKIAAHTDGAYQYHFFVYPRVSPEYEPIALPGGPVFIAQSMLTADGAETAAILAHAIAHVVLRHYTRAQTQRELAEIGRKAAGNVLNAPSTPALEVAIRPRFGPFELDADKLAVKLLIDAGYEPQALVRWLESFPLTAGSLAFGDRPTPSRRVAAARQAIEDAR